jgi:hypothetical protein
VTRATLHSGRDFPRGVQGTPSISKGEKASLTLFPREGKREVTLAIVWFLNLDKESFFTVILSILLCSFASGLAHEQHLFHMFQARVDLRSRFVKKEEKNYGDHKSHDD